MPGDAPFGYCSLVLVLPPYLAYGVLQLVWRIHAGDQFVLLRGQPHERIGVAVRRKPFHVLEVRDVLGAVRAVAIPTAKYRHDVRRASDYVLV